MESGHPQSGETLLLEDGDDFTTKNGRCGARFACALLGRTGGHARPAVPRQAHWQRNHEITAMTLAEDFAINEQVQAGVGAGANEALTFGRYEGALNHFIVVVEKRL